MNDSCFETYESFYTDVSGKTHGVKHRFVDLDEAYDERIKRISRELCEIFSNSDLNREG